MCDCCASEVGCIWGTASLMWRFEVQETAAHSTALDPCFPLSISHPALIAWRHPSFIRPVCHVCDWFKGTEEEGGFLKLLFWGLMWDLMRGNNLRCKWQTRGIAGKQRACTKQRCSLLHMTGSGKPISSNFQLWQRTYDDDCIMMSSSWFVLIFIIYSIHAGRQHADGKKF